MAMATGIPEELTPEWAGTADIAVIGDGPKHRARFDPGKP